MVWKILFIVIGVLVAIPLLVALIGMMLPQKHQASRSVRFVRTPPQKIFETITNWRDFPTWRSGVNAVEERKAQNGNDSWIEHSKQGTLPFEVTEKDPPHTLVTHIADPKLPFGGSWTWKIEPDGGGCRVTVTEDGEIYNPIFRTVARFVFGYTATMEAYLKDLGQKLGEPVTPQ